MEKHYRAWKRAFALYGIKLKEDEYYHLEGSKLIKIAESILLSNKLPKKYAFNLLKQKEYFYNQKNKIIFYQDVKKIIKKLKIYYNLGIVTATKQKTFNNTIPKDFVKNFDIVITGDQTKYGKPSPEPYILAAKKLEKNKSQCIVVENAPLGIKSAKKAGMYCIAISSTMSKSYLKKADIIIDKFNEILKLNVINKID